MIPGGMFPPMQGNGVPPGGAPALRYNFFEYTEVLDNAYWRQGPGGVTVTPNADGSAELVYPSSSGSFKCIAPNTISVVSGTTYTFKIRAKYSGVPYMYLYGYGAFNYKYAWFNIQNGTLGTVDSVVTANIVAAGDGYYDISFTQTATGTGTTEFAFNLSGSNGGYSVTASGSSGILLTRASFTTAADASLPYQWVTNSSTWNEYP